jgi:hypothetical protein
VFALLRMVIKVAIEYDHLLLSQRILIVESRNSEDRISTFSWGIDGTVIDRRIN